MANQNAELDNLKKQLTKLNQFVKQFDPTIRAQVFELARPYFVESGASEGVQPSLSAQATNQLERISRDAGVQVERLSEVYSIQDGNVIVIDPSLPNSGPADLVKRIALLHVYGNVVGGPSAKVPLEGVYANLALLKAKTTAYARDVRKARGIKVVHDGVMVSDSGRELARDLLRRVVGGSSLSGSRRGPDQ